MADFVKLDDDKVEELVAKIFCHYAGLQLEDEVDGSPNWWAFSGSAKKALADIRARFPRVDEQIAERK